MLKPKFIASLSGDSTNILFKDTTGDYEATSYPYGWGAPNAEEADITSAILTVTKPGADYNVGTDSVVINLMTYGYPLATKEFMIPVSLLGYEKAPDGAYEMKLELDSIDDGAEIEEYTWTVIFRNGIICCLDALVSKKGKCKCGKLTDEQVKIMDLQQSLYAISKAEDWQDIEAGVEELIYAKKICDNVNCKPCRGC